MDLHPNDREHIYIQLEIFFDILTKGRFHRHGKT